MDRNGKLVTRHVRSTEQPQGKKVIPAPTKVVASSSLWDESLTKEENATTLAKALMLPSPLEDDHLVSPSTRTLFPVESVVIMLEYMSEEDMKPLSEFIAQATPYEKEVVAHQVDVALADARRGGAMPSPITRYFTRELHYTAVVAETLRGFARPDDPKFHRRWITDLANQASMVAGVIQNSFKGSLPDLLRADESEKRSIKGFAAALGAVGDDNPYAIPTNIMQLDWFGRNIDALKTYSPIIKAHGDVSKQYVERLMKYPIEEIMSAYEHHGATDINVLEGLLNNTAAPVAEGWL